MKLTSKEYHNARFCMIDPYPIILDAITETVNFCNDNNIRCYTSGKGSDTTKQLFLHFCIIKLVNSYDLCKSKYPKMFVFYPYFGNKHKVINHFIKEFNFSNVLKNLPRQHCKVSTKHDKDIEISAINIMEKGVNTYNKFIKFDSIHKLNTLMKMSKRVNISDFDKEYNEELKINDDKKRKEMKEAEKTLASIKKLVK